MDGDQIRRTFLEFFQGKGHLVMPSSSLVPAGDPTLLFTTAGMVQFKPYFMGEATPPARRITTAQKSFRTTDIDEVGDHKHLTFFEMLGNFSVGDYFKKEAIAMAWELVTEGFGLSPDRLFVTIHLDDEEAYTHWAGDIGVPPERIYRYGEKDNWWGPAGKEGPCGPCSEIHYDFAPEQGCGPLVPPEELTAHQRRGDQEALPSCHPNCHCERFVELWNLVFMQLYQDPEGKRKLPEAPPLSTVEGQMQHNFGGPVDVIVRGSTHRAEVTTVKGVLIVNPGSPTFPNHMSTRLGTVGFLDIDDDGRVQPTILQLE